MISNPSFYRTIHTQPTKNIAAINTRLASIVKRHAIKFVVSAVLFVLIFTSFMLMGTNASGSNLTAASEEEQLVTVFSGDTLWAIAKRYAAEENDLSYVVYLIQERNGLKSADLQPGQKLVIPSLS